MKRYLLFAGYKYYPSGGWEDFIESFDDIQIAILRGQKLLLMEDCTEKDWWRVVDSIRGENVASGGKT